METQNAFLLIVAVLVAGLLLGNIFSGNAFSTTGELTKIPKCEDCGGGEPNCLDTDNGLNIYIKGNVTGGGLIKTDKCIPPQNTTVTEFYCQNGLIKSDNITCPSTYKCNGDAGACSTSTSTSSVFTTSTSTSTSTSTTSTVIPSSAIFPIADTYVDEKLPGTSFGSQPIMLLWGKTGSRQRIFMKFSVTGLTSPVLGAQLHLDARTSFSECFVQEGSSINSYCLRLFKLNSNSWDESINWNTQPSISNIVVDSRKHVYGPPFEVALDVTSAINGNGVYSFAVLSTYSGVVENKATSWGSREQPDISYRPWLEIVTE